MTDAGSEPEVIGYVVIEHGFVRSDLLSTAGEAAEAAAVGHRTGHPGAHVGVVTALP